MERAYNERKNTQFQVKSFGGDYSLTKTLCSVLLWHRHLSLKQMSPHKPENTTFLYSLWISEAFRLIYSVTFV